MAIYSRSELNKMIKMNYPEYYGNKKTIKEDTIVKTRIRYRIKQLELQLKEMINKIEKYKVNWVYFKDIEKKYYIWDGEMNKMRDEGFDKLLAYFNFADDYVYLNNWTWADNTLYVYFNISEGGYYEQL